LSSALSSSSGPDKDVSLYEVITSNKSETAKNFRLLATNSNFREHRGFCVVEGKRLVLDLFFNEHTRPLIKSVLINKREWQEYVPYFHNAVDVIFWPTKANVMKFVSNTVTNQGIIAMVRIPSHRSKQVLRDLALKNNNTAAAAAAAAPMYLVLDGVSDPGNVGTLFRTAKATGVTAVFLLPGSADAWNPKVIRSAMGASFTIPIFKSFSWETCLMSLERDYNCTTLYAATMYRTDGRPNTAEDSVPHYQVDWCGGGGGSGSGNSDSSNPPGAVALVIGNEANGLTEDVRESIQKKEIRTVHVPMEPGTESLNAAVCGSVILFEAHRQKLMRIEAMASAAESKQD
jgi:RNA methyltransferase, TrmH family